jgi:hypothetical protein
MAELVVVGGELVLRLTVAEKVEGVHGDLRAPVGAVAAVEVIDDAHGPAGVRAGVKVGTRIPGVIEVGTIVGRRHKIFAAVHHDTPRGVRVRFDGFDFDEWIVGCADPEAVVRGLDLPAR